MKIHQLPMGARFEFEGQEYVKTGPMIGTGPAGQRFFPRYAVLTVAGNAPAAGGTGEAPSRAAVHAAFEAFRDRCTPLVPPGRQEEWRAACEQFRKVLG